MRHLRANTQVKVVIGPVVAVGDGFTPVTTLSLSTADEAELMKHDAASVTSISAATFAAITGMDGYYNLTLTASHTDTEGMLVIGINDDSLCLPVRQEFTVLSEAAYDSLYVAKDDGFMDVNIKTIGRADTQETEANNLESACANYSATRGLTGTAVPAVAAGAAGGLPTDSTGKTSFNDIAATAIVSGGAITTSGGAVSTVTTVGTCTTNTDMRGTDNAALAATLGTPIDFGSGTSTIAANLQDMADNGTATFDRSTDSLQALRDWIGDGTNLTEAGGTGDHLNAVPWNGSWDVEVQSEVNDGLVAFWTSPATLVDLVWDEALSGHTTAGTSGKALSDAGAAGDPWGTSLPGAYGAGTAGFILGTNLDAVLSARTLATADYFDPAADTVANVTLVATCTTNTDMRGTDNAALAATIGTPTDFGSGTSTIAANLQDLADNGTATYDRSTDSLQAIRDRGDAAWITATSVTVSDKTGFSLASSGLDLVTAWTVDITGSLSGSVGSVTGNVGGNVVGTVASVVGAVGSVTGNVGGNVTGSVGSVLGGIGTSGGTITTLDALDTAQDTQHSTTRALIGTPSDFGSGTSTLAANLEDLADNGTATYDRSTDSLQAIRDRGDSAWITATSVSISDKTGFKLASDGLALVTAWTVDITGDITGNLSGSVGSVSGAVGSVTGNVGGNVTGSVGSVVGGINTGTGVITTLDALDTAQDTQHGTTQTAVAAITGTALTESYATLGAAATLPQLLYELRALTSEQVLPGTQASTATLTAKKLDGSTTAATYTVGLNASGEPISITRAT